MNAKQARDQTDKAIDDFDISEYVAHIDKLIFEKSNNMEEGLNIRYDYFKDYNKRSATINHYGKNGFTIYHNHRYCESFRITW